jgi:energy-coupling factor transport system substrate-specific component
MSMTLSSTASTAGDGRRWRQREIVITATLGIVFGVLYLAWVQLWVVAQALLGPLALDILFGFWCAGSVTAAYIIRKPGAALATEVIAALAEVLAGNPSGLLLLLTGLVQGLGAELPFALTGWRNYRLPVLLASGASAALFSFVYTWIRFSYGTLSPSLLLIMFVLRLASGALLAGWLGRRIAEALYPTGVLQGLGIDAAKRQAA